MLREIDIVLRFAASEKLKELLQHCTIKHKESLEVVECSYESTPSMLIAVASCPRLTRFQALDMHVPVAEVCAQLAQRKHLRVLEMDSEMSPSQIEAVLSAGPLDRLTIPNLFNHASLSRPNLLGLRRLEIGCEHNDVVGVSQNDMGSALAQLPCLTELIFGRDTEESVFWNDQTGEATPWKLPKLLTLRAYAELPRFSAPVLLKFSGILDENSIASCCLRWTTSTGAQSKITMRSSNRRWKQRRSPGPS